MSHMLKTCGSIFTPSTRRLLAAATSFEDLKACMEKIAQGMGGGSRYWEEMAWHKPAERGVVLILQGVNEESKRHMWSCADKPPKIDGRFFKEPTVEG